MNSLDFASLDVSSRQKIIEFRKLVFEGAFPKVINSDFLEWQLVDETAFHLVFKSKSEIVSYVRLNLITSPEVLKRHTLSETSAKLAMPVALLSRAATNPNYSRQGLYNRLRCKALEIAVANAVYSSVSAIPFSVERIESLVKIGYRQLENYDVRGGLFHGESRLTLMQLDGSEKLESAIHCYLKRYGDSPLSINLLNLSKS